MFSDISEVFYRINVNCEIDTNLLKKAFSQILSLEKKSRKIFMGSFLTAIMGHDLSVNDVVALLEIAFKVDNYDRNKVLVCDFDVPVIEYIGSGKKGIKTINISTPAAIVASACGAKVLKKGSHATSSLTGSADFMEMMGCDINIESSTAKDLLEKTNLAFVNIERSIPKFDAIYNGIFYAPNALSFGLAALVTPLCGNILLYGLAHPNTNLSGATLEKFGVKDLMVISSSDDGIHYLDEIGICGNTQLLTIKNGDVKSLIDFNPYEILPWTKAYCTNDISQKNTREENVKGILQVLKGEGEAAHIDIICINAANLLLLSNLVEDLKEGYAVAKAALKKGMGIEQLESYISMVNGDIGKLRGFL